MPKAAKPKKNRKRPVPFLLFLTPEEKRRMQQAADKSDQDSLSGWMRSRLRICAGAELGVIAVK